MGSNRRRARGADGYSDLGARALPMFSVRSAALDPQQVAALALGSSSSGGTESNHNQVVAMGDGVKWTCPGRRMRCAPRFRMYSARVRKRALVGPRFDVDAAIQRHSSRGGRVFVIPESTIRRRAKRAAALRHIGLKSDRHVSYNGHTLKGEGLR